MFHIPCQLHSVKMAVSNCIMYYLLSLLYLEPLLLTVREDMMYGIGSNLSTLLSEEEGRAERGA
jgi:hypothetical protein